ncbi:hypothetical protein KKH23_06825 [Patescibacteria group bacterium]|nr:hypothetical protein [Patescibacteria group bacterium]
MTEHPQVFLTAYSGIWEEIPALMCNHLNKPCPWLDDVMDCRQCLLEHVIARLQEQLEKFDA